MATDIRLSEEDRRQIVRSRGPAAMLV